MGLSTGSAFAGSKEVRLGGVAKGRIEVALLNFCAENRDHILLMVSCGGIGFFFFFDFDLGNAGGGGGGGLFRRGSESLELALEDILDDNYV